MMWDLHRHISGFRWLRNVILLLSAVLKPEDLIHWFSGHDRWFVATCWSRLPDAHKICRDLQLLLSYSTTGVKDALILALYFRLQSPFCFRYNKTPQTDATSVKMTLLFIYIWNDHFGNMFGSRHCSLWTFWWNSENTAYSVGSTAKKMKCTTAPNVQY